jgi:hypothetical protein
MATVLLVGPFRGLTEVLGTLSGEKLIHCHSVDSLRNELARSDVRAVIISAKEVLPSIFELMQEGQRNRPEVKWAIFVQQAAMNLGTYNTDRQLFFQGQIDSDWAPRLKRWLFESRLDHRKGLRRGCRGGVRIGDSEYSKDPKGAKVFGQIEDLSAHGAGLLFEAPPLFPKGEFVEIAFRDPQGQSRKLHAQVRWSRQRADGQFEVGLQFLAAA